MPDRTMHENLISMLIEEGLAKAEHIEKHGSDTTSLDPLPVWRNLLANGVINQGQADVLEMCDKGYIAFEAARRLVVELSGRDDLPAARRENPVMVGATARRGGRQGEIPTQGLRPLLAAEPAPTSAGDVAAAPAGPGGPGSFGPLQPIRRIALPPSLRRVPLPGTPAPSPAARAEPPDLVGRRLGKYQVQGKLGSGAWGVVYLGRHTVLQMPVAIKVMKPGTGVRKAGRITRFLNEARNAARINHPNVVRVLDCDEIEGHHLFVMEYVDGMSLQALIQLNGFIQEEKALAMAMAVAEGLEASLDAGVIHRDIKPANILVTKGNQVKLADLGLAKRIDGDSTDFEGPRMVLGTPLYFSPEQATGSHLADHRSDIYSLGATLHHSLTGQPPFAASNVHDLVRMHVTEPVPPPHTVNPAVSRDSSALTVRMMAKNPEHRHADYARLIEDIQTCILNLRASSTRGVEGPPRSRMLASLLPS